MKKNVVVILLKKTLNMRKIIVLFFVFSTITKLYPQFLNNGANVTIQPGATLSVESDVFNNGTSIITNNGTIVVSGDFINEPTAILTPNVGLIKFIGTENSDFDSGGDTINNLQLDKTSSSGKVILTSPLSVSGNILFTGFDDNRIYMGNNDLVMTSTTSIVSASVDHATNGWIVTDKTGTNTGRFVKNIVAGISTTPIEIGDDTYYTPVTLKIDAASDGFISARVITDGISAKYEESTDYINREWVIETSEMTTDTVTGTFVTSDIVGDANLIKGATYFNSDWDFNGSDKGTNTVTASNMNADFSLSGLNFFGKVDLKAYLQGPFSGGVMTTTLNTNGLIPMTSPYSDAPASVTSIPENVTDWIKIELRDPLYPNTPTNNKASAFIKNDGSIVGLDGSSLPRIKNGFSSSIVAVYHRNNLPFRTNIGLDVIDPTFEDFTITNSKLFDNGIDNPPLNTVSGSLVMWPCDIAGSTFLINSTDLGYLKSQSATTPSGYLRADVNLNGAANSTDLGMTKLHTAVPKSADL